MARNEKGKSESTRNSLSFAQRMHIAQLMQALGDDIPKYTYDSLCSKIKDDLNLTINAWALRDLMKQAEIEHRPSRATTAKPTGLTKRVSDLEDMVLQILERIAQIESVSVEMAALTEIAEQQTLPGVPKPKKPAPRNGSKP